jgi:hypothetical protein
MAAIAMMMLAVEFALVVDSFSNMTNSFALNHLVWWVALSV